MKNKDKLCKIHKLRYQPFLTDCPICVGEKMSLAVPPFSKMTEKKVKEYIDIQPTIQKAIKKKRTLSLWN